MIYKEREHSHEENFYWNSFLLVLLAFFIFYRKIHWNYYLMLLIFLIPFYFTRKGLKSKFWLLAIFVLCTQLFKSTLPFNEMVLEWLTILFSLLTLIILVWFFVYFSRDKQLGKYLGEIWGRFVRSLYGT
jgi:hypothetical protein